MTYLLSQSAKECITWGRCINGFTAGTGHMLPPNAATGNTSPDTPVEKWSVSPAHNPVFFSYCGETQEASYVKSKFEIFQTGLPGQLESVSGAERRAG